jgi:lipopolysaccharide export system protein LptA
VRGAHGHDAAECVVAMIIFSSNINRRGAALIVATVMAGVTAAHAQQPSSGPPNALQGFSQNRDKPIKINAESLNVRDKDKMATFSGDVHLVQGDVDMRSKTLVVFYDDQPPPPAPSPSTSGKAPAASAQIPPPQQQNQQSQQIKRVEAKGGVTVRVPQKDQTASGDQGIFDMRANTVTMQGHVVIAQGPNVLSGDTLTVDMNSGDSTLTCDKVGGCGRVKGLFTPGSMPGATKSENAPAQAQARPAQRSRSSQSQPNP